MDQLREGIGLRGYGQNNPLQAYALEGYEMFEAMQDNIDASIATFLLKMEIKQNFAAKQMEGNAGDGRLLRMILKLDVMISAAVEVAKNIKIAVVSRNNDKDL